MIGNSRLITRDPEQPFFENGTMAMDGTTIKKVGTLGEIKKEFHDAKYVDTKGSVIMPASINTYEHIYNAMTEGFSIKGYDPKGFLDILDGMWWTIDCHLTGEQTYQSARATYLDPIKNGVITISNHHASFGEIKDSPSTVEDAAKEVDVRTYLCYEVSGRDGMDKVRATVTENASWIRHALTDDMDVAAGVTEIHAQFTISDGTMELAAVNKPTEVRYHIHVVEGTEDLHNCPKEYGKGTMDRLMGYNILGEKTLLAHYTYVDPHEMQPTKDTDTMVVHSPKSNMGNACGCPLTMEVVYRGALTDLGTDGYTHDMTESFKAASVLHKHHLYDANVAWGKAPQMLFEDNTKIANRYPKKQLGVLRGGAVTDMIVADYTPLTPIDASNINSHILLDMTGRSAITVICSGKTLMKDRELMRLDEEEVLHGVGEEAKKLAHSIGG